MKYTVLAFLLAAISLTWLRLFQCPYVPFSAGVELFMALAHEINGAALGAAVILFVAREKRLGWIFFALWLIPGLIEGACFALHVSHR